MVRSLSLWSGFWLVVATALTVIGIGWLIGSSNEPPPVITITTSGPTEPTDTALPLKKATVAPPVHLTIPAIDVSTSLMRLGLQPDKTVEVPSDPDLAGWYDLGAPPGALGSAVILGHVDSASGPAVFYRLKELRRGQRLSVRRRNGSVVEFEVTSVATYPNALFPAQRVYAAQGRRRLNLVTCGGAYDSSLGGYQSNVVVYTRWVGTTR
jgi:hypothetical protein